MAPRTQIREQVNHKMIDALTSKTVTGRGELM
jgi:hypothetical protein